MKLLLTVVTLLALTGCSKINPLGFLTGTGTNVAANTQVGKENNQNIGVTTYYRPVARPEAPVDTIDQSNTTTKVRTETVETIVVNEYPTWLILVFGLLCGLLIPSPPEIFRGTINAIQRLRGKD